MEGTNAQDKEKSIDDTVREYVECEDRMEHFHYDGDDEDERENYESIQECGPGDSLMRFLRDTEGHHFKAILLYMKYRSMKRISNLWKKLLRRT